MPKKKPAKKKSAKKTTKHASKKHATKRTARKAKPKDHLDRAHRALMRAVPHVTREDLDALKRIEAALAHGSQNARGSRS